MLEKITLINYRNISSFEDFLSETSNVIIAPNSSGKTNFLEAIYYSTIGSSFKAIQYVSELIGPEKDFCRIESIWNSEELEVVVSNIKEKFYRKFSIDKKKVPISKVVGRYPVLIFAPNSVDLVSGEPSVRRSDLDSYLSLIDTQYKQQIERYFNLLKNRNALIKNIRERRSSQSELLYWTTELVKSASIVYSKRRDFFDSIAPTVKSTVEEMEIFLRDNYYLELSLHYLPNLECSKEDFPALLTAKFNENSEKEIAAGKTLYGPHKDDYKLMHGDKNLRYFGSRGQQRLATFLIKISQMTYYFDLFKSYPLFLIDDLMSELDNVNREKVASYLSKQKFQFIISSAERMEVPDSLFNSAKNLSLFAK